MVATVAACLLVMQTIFAPLALAAERTPARDALGGIICVSHPDADRSSQEKGRNEIPSCCMLGCNIFGSGLVAAPVGSLVDIGLQTRAEPLAVESDAGPFARPETHPRNPRAPPYLG